jgi:hypothetical protein
MGSCGIIKPEHPPATVGWWAAPSLYSSRLERSGVGAAPMSSVACLGGVIELGAAVGRFLDEVT